MVSTTGSGETRLLKWTVVLYLIVFIMKFVVYLFSGVMALLAEALHTLADLIISMFLLVAAIWSKKGADHVHRFGHGRAQNVAALVAATLFISFTSLRLYEEAIPRLIWPVERTYSNLPVVVGVLAISMVIAAAPLVGLYRQKAKGAAAKAQYLELINDQLGLLAAMVGSIFIIEGVPIADPIATIVVATIIAINALGLFRENISFLLGHSPSDEFIKKVKSVAMSVEGARGVHALKAEYIGPDALSISFHLEVPKGTIIEKADDIAEEVRRKIYKDLKVRYCLVHVDPEGRYDHE